MTATGQVGNYGTSTYSTSTGSSGSKSVTGDNSTDFIDTLFSAMAPDASQGSEQDYSKQSNDRVNNTGNDSSRTEGNETEKGGQPERDDSVDNESAAENESSDSAEEVKSQDNGKTEEKGSSEKDNESENKNDIEGSESQDSQQADGSAAVAEVKPEMQFEAVTDSEDQADTETASGAAANVMQKGLDKMSQDKSADIDGAKKTEEGTKVNTADKNTKLTENGEVEIEDTNLDVIEDSEISAEVDELVNENKADAEGKSGKVLAQQEKAVTAEAESTVTAEETVKTEKTEVTAVKENKQEEKDQDSKQEDYKKYDSDYTKSAASSSQHSQNESGTGGRQQQGKGYSYTDAAAALSGASVTESKAANINDALGLDKVQNLQQTDAARNVDNVVKSVKTMVQNGNSSVVVRLDPPELGQLNIKISTDSNGTSIEIQATNAKAQTMLQQNSNQLKSALENSGINVNNVDVTFKADTKNGANAGSDQRDSQPDFTDQNNGQHFNDQNDNESGESYRERFSTWSDSSNFQESEFAPEAHQYETAVSPADNWQELAFDSIDVTI